MPLVQTGLLRTSSLNESQNGIVSFLWTFWLTESIKGHALQIQTMNLEHLPDNKNTRDRNQVQRYCGQVP